MESYEVILLGALPFFIGELFPYFFLLLIKSLVPQLRKSTFCNKPLILNACL